MHVRPWGSSQRLVEAAYCREDWDGLHDPECNIERARTHKAQGVRASS